MRVKQISAIVALLSVVVLMPSCGDTFRPIAIPILQPSGDPNTVGSAFVIFTGGTTVNGEALQINLSGDTVTSAVALGLGPEFAFQNDLTSVLIISNVGAQAPGINTVQQFFTVLSSFTGASNTSLQSVNYPPLSPMQGKIEVPGKAYTNSTANTYVIINNPNDLTLNPLNVTLANEYLYSIGVIQGGTNLLSQEIGLCPKCVPTAMVGTSDGGILFIAEQNQGPGGSGQVFVLNESDNTLNVTPIAVEMNPQDMAITADNNTLYVMNQGSNSLSVINTATNTVNATDIPVGSNPVKLVYDAKLLRLYVINQGDNSITIINADPNATTANGSTVLFNGVIATVALEANANPVDLVASPDGTRFYVANKGAQNVAGTQNIGVYSTLNNKIVTSIDVTTNSTNPAVNTSTGAVPVRLLITPDSSKLLVVVMDLNYIPTAAIVPAVNGQPDGDAVLTINTGTNQVVATLGAPFTYAGCGNPLVMTDPVTHNQTTCTRLHPIAVVQ